MNAGSDGTRSNGRAGLFPARARAFVLLRLTLIIATSYVVLAQTNFASAPFVLAALLTVGLLSNLAVPLIPDRLLGSPRLLAAVILGDTVWITAALVVSQRFDPEFFYLYFFVLFLAAMGESLWLIVLGSLTATMAYFFVLVTTGGLHRLLSPGTLIRIPFLLAVAAFYGYLVERIRRESQRAAAESQVTAGLREQQQELEAANAQLQLEIQERRHVEEELKRVSEMKSAFISTVSHELKTPLTSIKNAVDLLAPSIQELGEPQTRFLDIARRNSSRLASIIGDLLDISRVEAGRMRFSFEELGLAELVRPVVAGLQPAAEQRRLSLSLEIDPETPAVWGDPHRIEQVVTNLLSNAIKFTPEKGTVTLTVERTGEDVEIAVRDTGIGLSEEDQRRIFEPFYQASDPLTDRARGTGLGLTISRRMVAAHGSDLAVESAPGEGSRFSFVLPAATRQAREITELEDAVREYSAYPFFSVVVAVVEGAAAPDEAAAALERVTDRFISVLPRASDRLHPQPASRRLVVVLLGTPREGGEVVRKKLAAVLADSGEGTMVSVFGPAAFPDDGRSGFELVRAARVAAQRKEPS